MMKPTNKHGDVTRFEQLIQPHLSAAYNLARWLVRDATAAQDVVQESSLRAFASLHQFSGGNARAWLLTIIRNQSYSWLKQASGKRHVDIDDETALSETEKLSLSHKETPEKLAEKMQSAQALQQALEALPIAFREVIILKELEGFAYKEIASVTGVPIGTVMSRLARGREMLKKELLADDK